MAFGPPHAAPAATTPRGWYHHNGKDFYRASRELAYRIDDLNGALQVVRMNLQHESSDYGIGPFGPRLNTLIGARALIEGDAHEKMKGRK
jgi:hypothetical protein